MHWGGGFGWGGMLVMMLLMLLFWGSVIVLGVLGFWALLRSRPGGPQETPRRALDVLQERYARGEITREQYEQMRRDLTP